MLLIALALLIDLVFAADYCKLCEHGSHTMCQFKDGPADTCVNYTKLLLTPADKMYILDIHNDIRNHVASGQESRGALGNQPAAGDMVLLEWNEELAKIAQRWVDQCLSINITVQHDVCRRTTNFEVGQNVVTAITPDGQLPELSVLILSWYKQIMYVIPSDIDEFAGEWKGKHQIGQYTQLVWAKTQFVGCAAAAFKETIGDPLYNVRLVCNYGPMGNVLGEPVYQRGKPCSWCPHRVCDSVRPNLCGGVDKNVVKQIPFYKKYKDKSTLSNMIDIEDPKIDMRFVNFSILNVSYTRETRTNVPNTTEFINFTSAEMEKDIINDSLTPTTLLSDYNFTNTRPISNISSTVHNEDSDEANLYKYDTNNRRLNNSTRVIEDKGYLNMSGSLQTLTKSNYTTPTQSINFNDNFTASTNTVHSSNTTVYVNKYTSTDRSAGVSTYTDSFNSSQLLLGITSSERKEKSNLRYKVNLVVTINILMENFFNQSSIPDILEKFDREDISIIDLNKNKCERKVKLNDITLMQACGDDSTHLIRLGKQSWYPNKYNNIVEYKFSILERSRRDRIIVKGNDITLPGNRRFKRAAGTWTNGHCSCIQFLRSCSTNLHVTRYLFVATSIVHFLAKQQ